MSVFFSEPYLDVPKHTFRLPTKKAWQRGIGTYAAGSFAFFFRTHVCPSDAASFVYTGCAIPTCSLPFILIGYNTAGCSGTRTASACVLACMDGFAGSPVASCPSPGTFSVSGCYPICTLPSLSSAYNTSSCVGNATVATCTLRCADGYSPTGIPPYQPSVYCSVAWTNFTVSGTCAATCTLPTLSVAYETTACVGAITASACALRCAPYYAGNPSVSCNNPGGVFVVNGACTAASWITVRTTSPFTARIYPALVVLNNTLYLIGGATGWVYFASSAIWTSPNGIDWTLLAQTTSFSPASLFYADVLGSAILITGGKTDTGTFKNACQKSTDYGVSWTSTNALFTARYQHAGAVFNGQLFVVGGSSSTVSLNDVWKTSDGVSWTQVTAAASFSARWGSAVIGFNGYLYLFGGCSGSATSAFYSDLWKSSQGEIWSLLTSSLGTGRLYASFVTFSARLYVMGGAKSDYSAVQTVYAFSSSTGTAVDGWVSTTAMPSPYACFGSVNFNGSVWIVAGAGAGDGSVVSSANYRNTIIKLSATCSGFAPCLTNYSAEGSVVCATALCTSAECCQPICTLPSLSSAYNTSGCVGYLLPTQCNLRCASGYSGILSMTCGSPGGVFSVSGSCDAICTLPSLSPAYDPTGCNGTILPAACALRCAPYYAGAPPVSCNTPTGVFTLNGVCTVASWFTVSTTSAFSIRIYPALLVVNNLMYLIGGSTGYETAASNEIWTTSNGIDWTILIQTTPFTKLNRFYADVLGSAIIITGGMTDGGSKVNTCQKSTDFGVTWTSTAGTFGIRYGHAGVVFNGQLYVIAGMGGSTLKDVWKTSDGTSWTVVSNTPSYSVRYGHAVIAFNGNFYLFGGCNGQICNAELWRSSDSGFAWTSITSSLDTPRHSASFAIFSGRLYLLGGANGNVFSTVIAFNASAGVVDGWVSATPMPSTYAGFGCVNYNGTVSEFVIPSVGTFVTVVGGCGTVVGASSGV